MQNVIHYVRLVEKNSYRFIGTSGFSRTLTGLDSFSEKVIVRGNFAKLDALFLPGTAHPDGSQFPDFYVNNISGGQIVPANAEPIVTASVEYQGVMNIAKRPVSEEYGVYIDSKYFAASSLGGSPVLVDVPGRPSGLGNIDVQQMVPSYRREYVTKTAPAVPVVNSTTGIQDKPTNFIPPDVPPQMLWIANAYAAYNYPNGWCLANRSTRQMRLAGTNGGNGALVPLFTVSEEWLFRPIKTAL